MHASWEQPDMVDIVRFPVGMRLHDKGPGFHQKCQFFSLLHLKDFGMLPVPFLLQAVDQEIRTLA